MGGVKSVGKRGLSGVLGKPRTCGQATIEAAFLIPLIFLLLLLLTQPCILLFDRMVMEGAAAEGCRMLGTSGGMSQVTETDCRETVLRHLGAIPPHPLFHLHEGSCSYEIELEGNELSEFVRVRIRNKTRPVPLVDAGATLLGLTDGEGCLAQEVEVTMPTRDSWVSKDPAGSAPDAWVHERD